MNLKSVRSFHVDWLTGVLVSLVFAFQSVTFYLVSAYSGQSALIPDVQSTNVKLGAGFVILLVVESLALVALFRLWKKLPKLLRTAIKYSLVIGFYSLLFYVSYLAGVLEFAIVLSLVVLGIVALDKLLERYNLDWITFDILAFTLGVAVTALVAQMVAPIVVLPVLVLSILWDYIAVDLSDIMGELIEFSTSAGIMNFLIIPNRLQVDYSAVKDYIQDTENNPKPKGIASIIGIGDFAIPGVLTASAWVAELYIPAVFALCGTAIAMVILADALHRKERGLPALPWLNTGALVGYGSGVLLTGMSISTALGV